MRQHLAPILYADHGKAAAEMGRPPIVQALEPSPAARRKRTRHRTDEATPLTSWRDLLRHLATLTLRQRHHLDQPELQLHRHRNTHGFTEEGLRASRRQADLCPVEGSRETGMSIPDQCLT